jgi:hypothetical protein
MNGGIRYASVDHLPERWRESARRQLGEPKRPDRKRSKYGAERINVDGIVFDSKREARHYALLKHMQTAGEIKRFHRQVQFDLEGGVRYICDFMVVHNDDRIEYRDAKGVKTKEFSIKRRMVRGRYGVEIVLV